MDLTIAELNELVYCLQKQLKNEPNSPFTEVREKLYDKFYTELEKQVKEL